MNHFTKFRKWTNRNDGKFFREDNRNLNFYEIIDHLFILASVIIYLLHDKIEFTGTWIGWVLLFSGIIFLLNNVKHYK